MRAVMEHHSSNGEYPAIEVIVSRGKEDICVKVIYKSRIYFCKRLFETIEALMRELWTI